MQRYFLNIAYKGTHYDGWQTQVTGNTIQDYIERAFAKVYQVVKIVGSGRTDAGVHARVQVAHVDLPADASIATLIKKLNGVLPHSISIQDIYRVATEMHARYSAMSRSYEYHITTVPDPFLHELSYYFPTTIDIDLMNKGAALLLGKKDFSSFCKKKPALPHYYCDLMEAFWKEEGSKVIFYIRANRFLHGMVRTIVGTLLELGRKKMTLSDLKEVIKAKERCRAGNAAPAQGLFLTKVAYDFNAR